jgi:hypothetical protein
MPENPPEGIVVTEAKRRMSFDGGAIILFIVLEVAGIPPAILAHWLYDKYFKAAPPSSRKEITLNEKHHEFVTPKDLETSLEEELVPSEEE